MIHVAARRGLAEGGLLAGHLLQAALIAIAEVAAELGYADAASFGKAFRKTMGMPPGAYRAV